MNSLASKIGKIVQDTYNSLNTKGKPGENEWTTLAVILEEIEQEISVVCLATGTKLVTGSSARLPNVIKDCHAESLCRRLLKKVLIDRISKKGKEAIDQIKKSKFHLFISQLPCGCINRYKGAANEERKKPGRGETSEKGTCSDKLAKWNAMGVQGKSLTAFLIDPIRFESITIGGCDSIDQIVEAKDLQDSIVLSSYIKNSNEENPSKKRKISNELDKPICPLIHIFSEFRQDEFVRSPNRKACPRAIIMYVEEKDIINHQVLVDGFRQGTTKKTISKSNICISPNSLNESLKVLKQKCNHLWNEQMLLEYDCKWIKLRKYPNFSKWQK